MRAIVALIVLMALSSCAVDARVTFLRKDGTYAVKGNSFKERW